MEADQTLQNKEGPVQPHKEVLQLYYQEKFTQKRIAEKMNISLSKVRDHLSRGMYLVRKEAGDPELIKAETILKSK